MKTFALVSFLLLFCGATLVQARYVPRYNGRQNRNQNGIDGTVEGVGSAGFTLSAKNGKTIKILCNANTVYRSGKSTAAASDIHEGVRVRVQGGTLNTDEVMANTVEILPAAKHSKKKKK